MKKLHAIAFILVIIGGLNWLLVGLDMWFGVNWNIVNMVLGSWPSVEALVYVLVGLSAVYLVTTHKKDCKHCDAGSAPKM